jgi:hypothetical protein
VSSATWKSWKNIKSKLEQSTSFANLLPTQPLEPRAQNNSVHIPREHKTKLRWELTGNQQEKPAVGRSGHAETLQSVLKSKCNTKYGNTGSEGTEEQQPATGRIYSNYSNVKAHDSTTDIN